MSDESDLRIVPNRSIFTITIKDGIAFAPDWVGALVYDPDDDPRDRVLRPGEVVNSESMFYLPENEGVSWLINSIMFEEAEAKLLSEIPSEVVVIE